MSSVLIRKLRTRLDAAVAGRVRAGSGRALLVRWLRNLARVALRAAVFLRRTARALEATPLPSVGDGQGPAAARKPVAVASHSAPQALLSRLGSRVAAVWAKADARRAQAWLDLRPDRPPLLAAVDSTTRFVALYGGGLVLALLMTVILVDVVGRYRLNAPLPGALDLSVVMLVLTVACAIAYAGRAGAHVTADMITTLGSPGFERGTAIGIRLLACLVTGAWCWRLYVTGGVAGRLGEGTQLLNIPYEPIYKIMSIGVGLYCVALAVEAALLIYKGDVPVLDAEREQPRAGPS